jgi:hypothetical protein
VRYRLCPTDSCSSTNAAGCNAGYGDYIVDLNTFVYYYMKNKAYVTETSCYYAWNTACPCQDKENCDNSQCLKTNGYDYCVNYYNNANAFVLENYLQTCTKYAENGDIAYYLGPYCTGNGHSIVMGLFTDATCTTLVDSSSATTFSSLSGGVELPYSTSSMVHSECTSCQDDVYANGNKNNYNHNMNDGTGFRQLCTQNYLASGKCETRLESISSPNTNGCTYMDGIKMTRTNGVIFSTVPSKSKVASAFIGIFSVCFILLGAYVYYLKSKLDRVKVNLSD